MKYRLLIHPGYRRAIFESFVPQAFVVLISGLMTDFGQTAQLCMMPLPAYWAAVVVLIWRNPTRPTRLDLSLIRIGYLPVIFLTVVIAPAIWHWRGVL